MSVPFRPNDKRIISDAEDVLTAYKELVEYAAYWEEKANELQEKFDELEEKYDQLKEKHEGESDA